jgi:hypothetical protein
VTAWIKGMSSIVRINFPILFVRKRQTTLNIISSIYVKQLGMFMFSIIEILERFQSKALHMIVDALWYVPNTVIRRDLQMPTIKEEICRYSSQYSAHLSAHPNDLIVNLIELPDNR